MAKEIRQPVRADGCVLDVRIEAEDAAQNAPAVSVLMPVYNGAAYLAESLASILAQTYGDFEVVVVDDGSTDATGSILRACTDPRLRVLGSAENCGIAVRLNEGLAACKGRYVARLDADDAAESSRLQRQVEVLDSHPECVLVTGGYEEFSESPPWTRAQPSPRPDIQLRWELLFLNTIVHSSVMFRREVAISAGGYSVSHPYAEDYALWSKLLGLGQMYGVGGITARIRKHGSQVTSTHAGPMNASAEAISADNVGSLLGRVVSREVASFLRGSPQVRWDAQLADDAWIVLQRADKEMTARCQSRSERLLLAHSFLLRVTIVVQAHGRGAGRGLWLALRAGLLTSPELACTSAFWLFVARMMLPDGVRAKYRRMTARR